MGLFDWFRDWRLRRQCRHVGPGTRFLGGNTEISGNVELGAECDIGGNVVLRTIGDGRISLADGATVADYAHIEMQSRLEAGPGVYIGPFVVLRDTRPALAGTDVRWQDAPAESGPITLGPNVYVSASSTVLPGVHIGEGAVIAPGSMVCSDVGPFEIWAGAPASRIALRGDSVSAGGPARSQDMLSLFGLEAEPAAGEPPR